jgi:misacylated tRNA(Ala) deacylase
MTEKLFLEDQYKNEFEAAITNVENNRVVLNKTCFYPEGGGQPGDRGEINGVRVIDTKKEGNNIFHIVEVNPGFKVDDKIMGRIDWNRRYKLMRMHTAAHLLSSIINKRTGAMISGNQLEEDKSRIDFNLEVFDKEKVNGFVEEANQILKKNIEVNSYYMNREEAEKTPDIFRLMKAFPEDIKSIRIVEIAGVDKQADGGTHVKNLNEVGKIEILKFENKGKNNRRLYFKLAE